jgi:hypothetical protein
MGYVTRCSRWVCPALAGAAVALIPAPATAAQGPPISNLGPANGAVVDVSNFSTGVTVQFTCPSYTTSYFSTVSWSSYWVEFATRPDLAPDGTLATAFTVDFDGAFPTNAAETECRAELSGIHAYNPATYYWQVHRIDCDAPNCHVTGPVGHFTTHRPAAAPLPLPTVPPPPPRPTKPACSDRIDNDSDGQLDLRDWGCNTRLDNSERLTQTPTLHRGEAVRLLKTALRRRFKASYRAGYGKRHRCTRASRTAFGCKLGWVVGDLVYDGRARISQRRRGQQVFWSYRWRIRQINEYCLVTGGRQCTEIYRVS